MIGFMSMSFAHLLRKNAIMRPSEAPSKVEGAKEGSLVLILDNIYDTFNVGGMYRVADAAGVSHIYHCEHTPLPPDPKIARSSVGLHRYIPYSHCDSTLSCIGDLKKKGYQIVALEQHDTSQPYDTATYSFPCALVVGNETFGVQPSVLENSDVVVELPMYGINKSVNVVVATGISLYQIRRSHQ